MNQGSSVPAPMPGDVVPPSEGAGAVGSDPSMFARVNHQHPRITSSTPVVLDANGAGVATFTRSFSAEPMASFTQMPMTEGGTVTGPPVICRVKSWIKTGANFTGANIEGFMLAPPASLAAAQVLGISVTIGGQTITTFGPAANVKVSAIMLPNSGV